VAPEGPVVGTRPRESEEKPSGLLGRFRKRPKISEEQFERRLSAQFAQHWAQVRAERRHDEADVPPVIQAGESNFRRAQVPFGVDLAAAWAWRFIVIVAAGYLVAKAIGMFAPVVLPVVIAMFLAALVSPLVDLLESVVRRGVAAIVVVVTVLALLVLMLTFATQQVANGATDLAEQVVDALDQIRHWLQAGPLHVTDKQLDDAIGEMQNLVTTGNKQLVERAQTVGSTIGHIVAGFFIVLFATFFFLADGRRIWSWVVRLFPRAARERADGSGRVAWLSLTQFVRATVLVALVDAVGIMIVAAILKVPFVLAIGVLVFLGGFVPLVGATISGSVAVLVALVAQGPIAALIMLGGVIGVQQLEAHVLQPFLLGRMVSVHPLGVILGVAGGAFFAGIPGALVAVPLIAAVSAVASYLSSDPPDPPDEEEISEPLDSGEAEQAGVTPHGTPDHAPPPLT
jgi:predicted PurR-regulated permease PerM